jgi:hypothetical protein
VRGRKRGEQEKTGSVLANTHTYANIGSAVIFQHVNEMVLVGVGGGGAVDTNNTGRIIKHKEE